MNETIMDLIQRFEDLEISQSVVREKNYIIHYDITIKSNELGIDFYMRNDDFLSDEEILGIIQAHIRQNKLETLLITNKNEKQKTKMD